MLEHKDSVCDKCCPPGRWTPIVGRRWKCGCCADFDLCDRCVWDAGAHDGLHVLFSVGRHVERFCGIPVLSCRQKKTPLARRATVVHTDIMCDHCDTELQGARLKCAECEDYDLCEACFRAPHVAPSHKVSHSFFLMRTHWDRLRPPEVEWRFGSLASYIPKPAKAGPSNLAVVDGCSAKADVCVGMALEVLPGSKAVSVFASPKSWTCIRTLRPGQSVEAAGAPQKLGKYTMVPLRPSGAVELRFVRLAPDRTPGSPEFAPLSRPAAKAAPRASRRADRGKACKTEPLTGRGRGSTRSCGLGPEPARKRVDRGIVSARGCDYWGPGSRLGARLTAKAKAKLRRRVAGQAAADVLRIKPITKARAKRKGNLREPLEIATLKALAKQGGNQRQTEECATLREAERTIAARRRQERLWGRRQDNERKARMARMARVEANAAMVAASTMRLNIAFAERALEPFIVHADKIADVQSEPFIEHANKIADVDVGHGGTGLCTQIVSHDAGAPCDFDKAERSAAVKEEAVAPEPARWALNRRKSGALSGSVRNIFSKGTLKKHKVSPECYRRT